MDQKDEDGDGELPGKAMKLLVSQMVLPGRPATIKRSWWILMIAVTITRVRAQDSGDSESKGDPSERMFDGVHMLHASYQLESFDCDELQDIVTRSIPRSCNLEVGDEP